MLACEAIESIRSIFLQHVQPVTVDFAAKLLGWDLDTMDAAVKWRAVTLDENSLDEPRIAPARHFHSTRGHVKVIAGHLLLVWRTVKVIAPHFHLNLRTVALARRSLFSVPASRVSDRSALESARGSLPSSGAPSISMIVCGSMRG